MSKIDKRSDKLKTLFIWILAALLVLLFFYSFLIGRYHISVKTVIDIVLHKINLFGTEPYWEPTIERVVLDVRFPRIVLAILIGGALSVAGASYQTLFKNPMVSPDILGVSAGAGFGAALMMLNNGNWWEIQLAALVFGLIAVGIAWFIGFTFAKDEITVMVLAGVVVSAFFWALLSIVKTLADTENALPSITFWLMGSLGRGGALDVWILLPALLVSMFFLFLFRYQIDVLSLSDDEAKTIGINIPLLKIIIILCATIITVISVSICGIVGWVGLVVPHIARILMGSKFSNLLISSFLVGGLFLLVIDNVIRGIQGAELPLGVLTALVGTPLFLVLLSRLKKGWG